MIRLIEAVAVIVSLWLLMAAFRRWRFALKEERLPNPPRSRWIWAVMQMAGALLIGWNINRAAAMYFDWSMLIPTRILSGAMVAAISADALILAVRPPVDRIRRLKSFWMGGLFLLMGLAGSWWVQTGRLMPFTKMYAVWIENPVEGQWRVTSGGKKERSNHHRLSIPAEHEAVDLEMRGAPGVTLGQPVFAPIDGMVIRAVTNETSDVTHSAEGNVVVIERDRIRVTLAHLQEGSVAVREGDNVRAGEMIARCGMTGNAEQPHLHIHAESQGRPIPIFWSEDRRYLVRGDKIDFELDDEKEKDKEKEKTEP